MHVWLDKLQNNVFFQTWQNRQSSDHGELRQCSRHRSTTGNGNMPSEIGNVWRHAYQLPVDRSTIWFLHLCTVVQSAVLRLHVVRLSVCLSVCDVGGSGSHRSEILETNCTDNTFALRSPKTIHLVSGDMGKFGGDIGWKGKSIGGVGKVLCWSTKASISQKRVKIEEKLLWRVYRNSPTLFWTVPSPTPIRPPLPQDWGFATPPKISIAIISRTGKAADFKSCRYIQKVHPNKKNQLKILEKRERRHI